MKLTKELYEELKIEFEWIRKCELFTGGDIARLKNSMQKFMGQSFNCNSCKGGLAENKWKFVGYCSNIIQQVESGAITFQDVPQSKEIVKDFDVVKEEPKKKVAASDDTKIVEKAKKQVNKYTKGK
jgi:hypothetical protein